MAGRDEFKPVAHEIYADSALIDCSDGETVQEVLEDLCQTSGESVSPGFQFGREGQHGPGTWLIGAETISSRRGIPFGLGSGSIKKITVCTQNTPAAFSIEVWHHNGNLSGSTLVGAVTTSGTGATEDFVVNWPVPSGVQLAVKVSATGNPKPKETGVFIVAKGTIL